MSSLASARLLNEKFNFLVTVDGMDRLFFQKCSELSRETAKIDYYEGGALIPIKWPGRVTMSDVTLERGVGTDTNFDTWARQVADPALAGGIGAGLRPDGFTRNMTVLNRDRTKLSTIRKYVLYGVWPTKYIAGEWDNTVDEVVIESLTLTFDRWELITPTPTAIRVAGI